MTYKKKHLYWCSWIWKSTEAHLICTEARLGGSVSSASWVWVCLTWVHSGSKQQKLWWSFFFFPQRCLWYKRECPTTSAQATSINISLLKARHMAKSNTTQARMYSSHHTSRGSKYLLCNNSNYNTQVFSKVVIHNGKRAWNAMSLVSPVTALMPSCCQIRQGGCVSSRILHLDSLTSSIGWQPAFLSAHMELVILWLQLSCFYKTFILF